MANHRLLNLDTSNLPPIGIPPSILLPVNQWLHGWNAVTQQWIASQPRFEDIAGNLTTGLNGQQRAITELGTIRVGTWLATPLSPSVVPTLDQIRSPLGNVSMTGKRLVNVANPVDSGDAVNKGFMDFLLQGLVPKQAVRCATSTGRETILTGLGPIDGIDLAPNDRVLVKLQGGAPSNDGIWIAATGSWTRSDDANTEDELARAYVSVLEGSINAGTSWVQVNAISNFGTDHQNWIQFSGGGSVNAVAGAGLTADGTTLNVGGTPGRIAINADSVDIAADYAGQNSIATLGVVTAGSWHGDVIGSEFGGTGNNNLGFGIHLEGDLSVVNPAFALGAGLIFQVNGFCHVIVPPGGTLATLTQQETFANKRITRRVVKIASNSRPSIDTDNTDAFCITGLTEAIASMSDNLLGTPLDRQELEIWIKDATGAAGPAYSIAWGGKFMDSDDLPLPAVTIPDMWLFLRFVFALEISKWVLVLKLNKIS